MSFKKGTSKKTWNSVSNTTSNSSTKQVVPDWITSPVQRGAGLVEKVAGLDPTSLVAPASALQMQAAAGAAGLGQWQQPQAVGLPKGLGDTSWSSPYANAERPIASGGKAYDYKNQYLDPYLKDVVESSAKDFDADADKTRAQQALDLAASGAFGGSGAALTQSMTEDALARARIASLSGLKSRGFEIALQAAAGDADRATQARIANAENTLQDRAQKIDLGFRTQAQQLANDENARANINTQAALGDTFRNIENGVRTSPVTHAQQVAAILSGLPFQLFPGQEKNETTHQVQSGKEKNKESSFGLSIDDLAKAIAMVPK